MAKEKKKGGCGTFLIAILIMGAIGSIFGDDEPKEEKQNNQVVESQESTQKEDDTVETEVVVEEQEFAESKNSNSNSSEGGFGGGMNQYSAPAPMAASDGFMNIPDGIDEELPFN